ncbi:9825_t:CDS:10 [Cetraspora pellucida]|uniref:9825_t:CDS:1 n=1 Tax=Cetraspora pellucida TaxID=1433469 RepID=A0A9N9AMQ1_9GLOM|nr:9825_t:CDS:10 [Cetraspora pellucida]
MATFATDKDLNAVTSQDVHLGVNSFSAIACVEDRDVTLATATTEIFGRFQFLKTLLHPNICEYVEIVKGKHGDFMTREWAFQILKALAYLNKNNITHHNLAPNNILLDSQGRAKLADYGLYFMTKGGANVDFPIGYPHYIPPEAIYRSGDMAETTGKLGISEEILDFLQGNDGDENVDFRRLVRACLEVNPSNRCSPEQLLSHPYFSSIYENKNGINENYRYWWIKPFLQSQRLKVGDDFLEHLDEPHNKDVLDGMPLSQIYYFWKLAGGDVESELAKRGYMSSTPPIERIPRTVKVLDGKEEGTTKDTAFLYSDTVYSLPLKELRQRLRSAAGPNKETFEWDSDYFLVVDENDMNFLVEEMLDDENLGPKDELLEEILGKYLYPDPNNNKPTSSSANGQSPPSSNNVKSPLLAREKDVVYQFQRVALFSELLRQYPASRDEIIHQAKVDIPPFLRGKIWAAILGINGDYQAIYDAYDKETEKENQTDRQIDVDVPRCHQYHQLLSSPVGHDKLRRLLKCFVAANKQNLVYWQGLDSLCAPFLTLNFNDEALAFSCYHAFIPKFMKDFFISDNSSVIREYLAVFSHLLSFHDPELSRHLNKIGYKPDLYAVPWFLTLFTHVFPLDKTYHLWDKVIVGPPSLPLFTGVSIIRQFRDTLIKSEFNDCLMVADSFPNVDIEKCVQSALSMYKVTPPSVIYRVHESDAETHENQHDQRWWEQPTPIEVKEAELAPRISLKDLVKLKNYVLVIDTRTEQEFGRGHFPLSINMNPAHLEQLSQTLWQEKKKYHVVVGEIGIRGGSGPQFASDLVEAGFPRVAVLNGGINVMRVDAVGVVVCSCACTPIKPPGVKNKDGAVVYWKCSQNLMN